MRIFYFVHFYPFSWYYNLICFFFIYIFFLSIYLYILQKHSALKSDRNKLLE